MPKAPVRRSTCSSRFGTVRAMWARAGVVCMSSSISANAALPTAVMRCRGLRPLEQLNGVAGGVVEQRLRAAEAPHDVVAERQPGRTQACHLALDVVDEHLDARPAAW